MPSRRASVVAAQAMPDIAAVATQCTCLNLRRITRKVTQRYDEWLAPSGLRATQFSLLGILHAPGEVSISGLAERMDIDRTTLTRNLQLLEQGLVAIGTGSDPRSRTVSVTKSMPSLAMKACSGCTRRCAKLRRVLAVTDSDTRSAFFLGEGVYIHVLID